MNWVGEEAVEVVHGKPGGAHTGWAVDCLGKGRTRVWELVRGLGDGPSRLDLVGPVLASGLLGCWAKSGLHAGEGWACYCCCILGLVVNGPSGYWA